MEENRLLKPVRFRFTDPEDVKRWGDRWYVYDERAIVTAPARDLVVLESLMGMTLISAMNGFRADSVLGNLACCWLAVRAVDPEVAGAFDDFTPMVMLINYEAVPEVDEGKDEGSPTSPASESADLPVLVPTPTVTLQTLPVAE